MSRALESSDGSSCFLNEIVASLVSRFNHCQLEMSLVKMPSSRRAENDEMLSNTSQLRAENNDSLGHRQQAGRVPQVEHKQRGQIRVPDVVGIILRVPLFDDVMAD